MKKLNLFIRHEEGNATIEVLVLMSALVFLTFAVVTQIGTTTTRIAEDIGTVANAIMAEDGAL